MSRPGYSLWERLKVGWMGGTAMLFAWSLFPFAWYGSGHERMPRRVWRKRKDGSVIACWRRVGGTPLFIRSWNAD